MDPAKLKVVELRAELAKRGLDQKGVKAILVARLQEALDAEEKEDDEDQGEDEVLSDHGEELLEINDSNEPAKTDPIAQDETSTQSLQSSEQDLTQQEEDSYQFVSYQEESESKIVLEANEDSAVKSAEENSEVSSEVPPADDETTIQKAENIQPRPAEETSGENSAFVEMASENQTHTVSHLDSEPEVSKQDEEMKENYKSYEDFSEYLTQEDSSSKNNFEDQSMDTWQQGGEEESERCFQLQDSSFHLDDSNAQDALENTQKSDCEDSKPDLKEFNLDKQVEDTEKTEAEDIKPPGTEDNEEMLLLREKKEEKITTESSATDPLTDQEIKTEFITDDDKRRKTEKREDYEREKKNRWDDNRSNDSRKRQRSPIEKRRWSPVRKPDDEPDYDEDAVLLSWYDSDLHMVINRDNFFSATMINHSGFGYVWAGARATFGFDKGKVYYEARITENLKVPYLEDEINPNVLRIGWSVQSINLQLGEEPLSYGFGATGKKSTKCQFQNYGKQFSVNDVVGCFLDLDSSRIEISYTINGEYQGVAFGIEFEELKGQSLFPHILTKNCNFEVNFGNQEPWFQPLSGYTNVGKVPLQDRIAGPKRPKKREDCEVIMMCGLPGSGKTTWALKHAQENNKKMYNILGTNALIDKMKVMGLPRIRNYSGRWENLIAKCNKCLNFLLEIGAYRRRNYIIDQTNVYPSAQRRKMRGFEGFVRRAVVIVPTDEDLKSRTAKREAEEGKDVPDTAILEMKANFILPEKGDIFDDVIYTELQEEDAKALIARYNREGNEAGYVSNFQQQKRFRSDDNRDRRDNFRGDNRQEGSDRGRMDNRGRIDNRGGHDSWRDRGFNNSRRRLDNRGGMGGGPPRPGNWRDNRGGGGIWRGGPPNRFNDRGGPGPRYMRDRNRDFRDRRDNITGGNKMPDRRIADRDDKNRPKSMNQSQSQSWGGQSQGNYNQAWGQGYANQAWGNWNQGYNQQQWKGYGQQPQQQGWGQQGWGNQGWANANWNQQYYNQYQQNWAQQQSQQASQQQQPQQQSLQHSQQQHHQQSSSGTESVHTSNSENNTMTSAYANYGSTTGTAQASTWPGYTTVGSSGYASMGAASSIGSAAGMAGGGGGASTVGLSASTYTPAQKQYRQDPRKAS